MNSFSFRPSLKRFATSLAAIAVISTIFGAKAYEAAQTHDHAPTTIVSAEAH